jgi:hypothetical protein
MPLDPSIALGVRPLEVPNQLAQYSQLAQIQNAQQQNALAQFQLGAARRAEQGQTALGQAYGEFYGGGAGGAGMGGVPGAAPGEISYDAMSNSIVNKLSKTAPHLIPSELAKIAEMKQKALLTKETQGKIDAQAAAQIDKSLSVFRQAVPAINDADSAVRYIKAQYADPVLGKVAVRFKPLEQTIEETIQRFSTPEGIRQWKIENAGITGDKLIDMMRQTTQTTDLGGQVRERKMDYFGNPVGEPTFTQKTPTVGDVTGQQRLAFDQSKFAWEKANPNQTIHETPTGFVAVNNRTGLAMPVVYGAQGIQAAPAAAAPGASMMRQPPPAAMPSQAIPGMPSVLDQTVRPIVAPTTMPAALPAGTPGTPVMGRQAELKPIPANINLAILKNNQSIQQIDDTIKLLQQNPNATGAKGYLPGFALNRMDPEGVNARAGVADIGSLVLHDRSGAAVTAAEAPRLMPFIPLATDDNLTVIKKLTRMRNIAAQDQMGLTETYGKDQGYLPNPTVGKTNAALGGQQIPPIYATNGKERIVSTDGGQTWTPAK